jgi:hypothetical protein
MNRDLTHYLKVFPGWIDADTCKKTVREISRNNWVQHEFYYSQTNEYHPQSGSRELDVSRDTVSTTPVIMQRIWDGYLAYTQSLEFAWFNGWSGFSAVRFNRYRKNRVMAEHCDHIHSLFDGQIKGIPTMSLVGLLNDNYEGGEFVMWQDTVIPLKQGDIMIFPSNFLYPHRVDPVTRGTRNSFVAWAW